MHDCASILYSMAKGISCLRNFSHGENGVEVVATR